MGKRKINMHRIIPISMGLLVVFIAVGLILPALAKVRDYGSMPGDVVGLYTLGVVLAIIGMATAAYGLRRRGTG